MCEEEGEGGEIGIRIKKKEIKLETRHTSIDPMLYRKIGK